VEGESIVAYKNITVNEEVFNGHFPISPIFPGVMIIEAMAQASGILGFKTTNKKPQDGSIYLFAGVDDVRFKRHVVPGDRLQLESRIISEKRDIWKFVCRAKEDGVLAASATILCVDLKVQSRSGTNNMSSTVLCDIGFGALYFPPLQPTR